MNVDNIRKALRFVVDTMGSPEVEEVHTPREVLIARLTEAGVIRSDLVGDPRFKGAGVPPGHDLAVRWIAGQLLDFLEQAPTLDAFTFTLGADRLLATAKNHL